MLQNLKYTHLFEEGVTNKSTCRGSEREKKSKLIYPANEWKLEQDLKYLVYCP